MKKIVKCKTGLFHNALIWIIVAFVDCYHIIAIFLLIHITNKCFHVKSSLLSFMLSLSHHYALGHITISESSNQPLSMQNSRTLFGELV